MGTARTLATVVSVASIAAISVAGCSGSSGPESAGSGGTQGGNGSSGSSGSNGSSGSAGGSGGQTSSSGSGGTSSGGTGSSGASSSGTGGGSSGSNGGLDASGSSGGGTYPALKFSSIGAATSLGGSYYFTEGPVWDPAKGVLYFTDINGDPKSGGQPGGVVYQLAPPSTVTVLFQPAGNTDGLGLDPSGNLLGAGFASRDAWRRPTGTTGTMSVLAPCSGGTGTCYSGMEINTPDDITSRSDGVLYFTDPTFGSGSQGFPSQTLPLSNAQGVYRLTTDGILHLEDSTTSGPNGVNLSPDEKTLYVSYTLAGTVSKFTVAADGSLSGKTTFATGATVADSMCVDAGGNVYVGTLSGLAVYDPSGTHLGTISAGGNIVTNCAFGGSDQKTLYITARTSATLSGTPPAGGGLLYQIANMPVPGMPGRN